MKKLVVPEFKTYKEEAQWWDSIDFAPYMEDDGEWFQFETVNTKAREVAILPSIALPLEQWARRKGVALETLVNVLLMEQLQQHPHMYTHDDQAADEPKAESGPAPEPLPEPAMAGT